MHFFGPLYKRVLIWARHANALYYLCGLSFVEAFIFPVMPEVMLVPMMLGRRCRAFFYANVSLLFSLLGSLLGYALGCWAFLELSPLLEKLHLLSAIQQNVLSLRIQATRHPLKLLMVLFLMAFQPLLPMKIITWAAGIVGVPIVPFLVCMALGRGKRVWLLALLVRNCGVKAGQILHRYIEAISWSVVVILVGLAWWWIQQGR